MVSLNASDQGAKAFARMSWARSRSENPLWRHMCALAAALNILVLMTANMVGFVVGIDGVTPLLAKIFADHCFMAGVIGTLFSASQIMFMLRQTGERRLEVKVS